MFQAFHGFWGDRKKLAINWLSSAPAAQVSTRHLAMKARGLADVLIALSVSCEIVQAGSMFRWFPSSLTIATMGSVEMP